jgi:hypothetical protein
MIIKTEIPHMGQEKAHDVLVGEKGAWERALVI